MNETLGKEDFKSLFKQVYQQTISILSLETKNQKIAFLNSVKNFESTYVYNWQRFVYPIFSGPESSPYSKYSGFRSSPWAEYDVLDPIRGGASGWTLTAEPWATESGLPCLWDGTRGQPNSITGALYCLSSRIDEIVTQDLDFDPYDDTEVRSLIHCNDLNIQTLYKDIYACDLEPNCSGNEKLQFSFQRHLYEIFSQIISGGPDLSGDFSCEDRYPQLFLNLSTCNISWDPSCPLVELNTKAISGGAKIELTHNSSAYDKVDLVGTGDTVISCDPVTQTITIDSGATFENEVNAITGGVELSLNKNSVKVDGTDIKGSGTVSVSRVSDSEIKIEGSNNIISSVDSKSILGQKGLTPLRAIDFYARTEEAECCYEYVTSPIGNATKASATIQITQQGVSFPGWVVSIRVVRNDYTTSNIYHELITFESSSNSALDGLQDPNSYNYYFHVGANVSDAANNLKNAISSNFSSEFNVSINSIDASIVDIESVNYGERFNTPIVSDGISQGSVVINGFSGGLASGKECIPATSPHKAQGSVTFIADFTNGYLGVGTKVTLESTDGTIITYRSESTTAGTYTNGQLDNGEVVFLNADDVTDPNVNFQTEYRYQAMLSNFVDAINSTNGHNEGTNSLRFMLYPYVAKINYTVSIIQSLFGSAGNTTITTLHAAPNLPALIQKLDFSGGSDSLGGVPTNSEDYSQEAFLERWDCTSTSIDLAVGKRFEITISGYNTFKDQGVGNCIGDNRNVSNVLTTLYEEIYSRLGVLVTTIGSGPGAPVLGRSLTSNVSQDLAGISLVLRPSSSCVEDPRNIYITPEYETVPEYIDAQYYRGGTTQQESVGALNKQLKSSVLAKNSFRNFHSKWKAKIELTIGPSSEGDPNKVNLYFKGNGIELDIFDYAKRISSDITSAYKLMSAENKAINTELRGGGGVPKHRFDFEYNNPFRHRYYLDGTSSEIYALEDFTRKLRSNVIENVPIQTSGALGMNDGGHYWVAGTVGSVACDDPAVLPQVFQTGDQGFFVDVTSRPEDIPGTSAIVEFTLTQYPGETFYMSAIYATVHPLTSLYQVQQLLGYYNVAYINGTINYRIFKLETCSVEAYDTLEIITWGLDSGRFSATTAPGDEKFDYYPPDGEIPVKVYLEEFSIKEFQGEAICDFESLNPYASLELGLSGGLPGASNCNNCPDWEVAEANELTFNDSNGNPISLNSSGLYNGFTSILRPGTVTRSEGSCDYEFCLEEIINDSELSVTTSDNYGYLLQDTADIDLVYNSTMTAPTSAGTWNPSSEFNTDEFYLHLVSDVTTMVTQLDFNTNAINVLSWTDQRNGFVLSPGTGDLDGAATEVAPTLVTTNNVNYVQFDNTLHQALSATFDSKMNLFDGVDDGSSMIAVVKLPQSAISDPIGDPTANNAVNDTQAQFLNIGRGSQMRIRRYLTGSNVWTTDATFLNGSNSWDAGLTGVVGTNQTFIIEFVFGQSGVANATKGIFVDGVKYSNVANPSGVSNSDFPDSPKLRIGRNPDHSGVGNPTQYFDNSFGKFELVEMMAFHRELLDTERQKLEGFLAHKYSLQNSLPANHPYKLNAPS